MKTVGQVPIIVRQWDMLPTYEGSGTGYQHMKAVVQGTRQWYRIPGHIGSGTRVPIIVRQWDRVH